jgi:hypothetical protein
MSRRNTRSTLESHLLWRDLAQDEFLSFTPSLLWALRHAVYRAGPCSYEKGNVNVTMIDTRDIETDFFPVAALLSIYDAPDKGKLRREHHSIK